MKKTSVRKTSELENVAIGTIQHETEMRLKKQAEHQCTLGQLQAV